MLEPFLVLLAYVVLMRWVLPWFGVPTLLSRSCNVAARRKPIMGQDRDVQQRRSQHQEAGPSQLNLIAKDVSTSLK